MIDRQEEELIKKSKDGDIQAYGALYELHLKAIYRFLNFRLKNHLDCEDLCETTFVKAWENLKKFKLNTNFRAWVFKIAQNLLIDFTRKKKNVSLGNVDEPSYIDDIEQKFYLDNEKKRLYSAIQKLPEYFKQVVTLRYLEEWEYRNIAEAMGKKEGAVRVMLSRALKLLKEILNEG